MDKRNSKESLVGYITMLEVKLEKVYSAGMEGIEYVGMANYASREIEAKNKLITAMNWNTENDEDITNEESS